MTAIYHGTCPETDRPKNYIGETAWRISGRVIGHTNNYVHSHLLKHAVKSGHEVLNVSN